MCVTCITFPCVTWITFLPRNINLEQRDYFTLGNLYNLKCLTLSHCMLNSVKCLKSKPTLYFRKYKWCFCDLSLALSVPTRLRVLNLSHNQLTNDSMNNTCALTEFGSLVKLDLSHNHLESVPLVLTRLNRSVFRSWWQWIRLCRLVL